MAGGTYTIVVTCDASGVVQGMRTVRGELEGVTAAAKETGTVFGGIFKFFAISEALQQLYSLSDAFLSIESNVKVASQGQGDLNQQTEALGEVALKTRGNFEALSTLYRNLGVNAESLGLSQKDLLDIAQAVSESFAVGGATSQEMKNGIIQLGHAFEQSKVQGQTLNAIVRDAPQLMLNVAKAANTNITGLKEMAKEGELSGKTLAQLTIKAKEFADAQFAKSIPTLSQAFIVLQTALILTINDLDHATGVMQLFSRTIIVVAQNIRSIAPFIVTITAAVVGVRIALAAYTATTTVASTATAIFGRNINLTGKEVFNARLGFAGFITVLAVAVTAIHQFGQNVPVTIGRLTNLRQVLLFVEIALKRVVSTEQGFVIAMGVMASAMLRFRGAIGQLPLAMAALYTAFRTLGFTATEASVGVAAFTIVILAYKLGVIDAAIQTGAWAVSLLGVEAAAFPLEAAIILITAALATMVVFLPQIIQALEDWKKKIEEIISMIPGINLLYAALRSLIELAWPEMGKQLDDIKKKGLEIQDTFLKWVSSITDAAKKLDEAKGNTEGAAEAAEKAAAAYQAAAENAAKMANAANAAAGPGGKGGGSSTTSNNANASNGSAAIIGNNNAVHIQYAQNSGGGSGSGSGGGNSGGQQPPQEQAGQFETMHKVPGGLQFDPSSGKYIQGPESWAIGATPIGQDPQANFAAASAEVQKQVALMNSILQELTSLVQQGVDVSKIQNLSADQLKLIELNTGATKTQIRQVEQDSAFQIKRMQEAYQLQQKMQQDAQEAAAKAQADAQKQQEELQKLQQIQQAHDSSLTQALLQALNNTGLDFVSQLDPATQKIANQIADLNAALVQITNPVQAAEYSRRIQVLTDALDKNTKAVQDSTDNPYLKYAQDVYGDATGIQGAKLTAQQAFAAQVGNAVGAAIVQHSNSSGSGNNNNNNNNHSVGGPGLSGRGSGLYLGAFASGGEIDIGADGLYSASLHAGERVSIKQNSPGGGESKTVNVVLNINGVRDTIGFNRSRKQILTSMYKAIMGAGSTA